LEPEAGAVVVGISGSLPFIDGADLRKPEFASYSAEESKWIIEATELIPTLLSTSTLTGIHGTDVS
jgi:hypothetical protein